MSVGSILIGIAVLTVVVAYLARPFRSPTGLDADRAIERWVAQLREEERPLQARTAESSQSIVEETSEQAVNYCPQCGRRVDSDDRFCSGCGTRLQRRTG
jgi:NADH pyrophosphatase NudC (nudix superfamily)